jgi:hypothetical protein
MLQFFEKLEHEDTPAHEAQRSINAVAMRLDSKATDKHSTSYETANRCLKETGSRHAMYKVVSAQMQL